MRTLSRALLALLSFASITVMADSDIPAEFLEIHNWQIVCDNTRTCRAAGYSDRSDALRASILLVRPAGPNQAVEVQMQLAHGIAADDNVPASVQLAIDAHDIGLLTISPDSPVGSLTPDQVRSLLRLLPDAQLLTLRKDAAVWTISTEGANEILFKMDEFQGRLDTAGALIQKGGKPESGVLAALPVPVLVAPAIPENDEKGQVLINAQRSALIADLGEELTDEVCDAYPAVLSGEKDILAYRLSKEKLLMAIPCSVDERASYSYWITNTKPPFHPVPAASRGTWYQNGAIVFRREIGAMGDCVEREENTWDGTRFVLTSASTTGMCRRIGPTGAWTLLTVVIEVRHPH